MSTHQGYLVLSSVMSHGGVVMRNPKSKPNTEIPVQNSKMLALIPSKGMAYCRGDEEVSCVENEEACAERVTVSSC